MVVKSEANCSKCFTQNQYTYKLSYDAQSRKFKCPVNPSHIYFEGENGFLKSA